MSALIGPQADAQQRRREARAKSKARTVAKKTDPTLASYRAFLRSKSHTEAPSGFTPSWMPDFLFDFQDDDDGEPSDASEPVGAPSSAGQGGLFG